MQSRHYEPLPSPSSALKAMAAILTRQAKVDKPRLRNWPDLNRTHVRIILSIMHQHGGTATFTEIRQNMMQQTDLPRAKIMELVRRITTTGMIKLCGITTFKNQVGLPTQTKIYTTNGAISFDEWANK